jgi:septum formation inhibitor MinC
MTEDNSNKAADKQQQGNDEGKNDDGQVGDGTPKMIPEDVVQKIVQKRVAGLSQKNKELEAQIAELAAKIPKEDKKAKKDDSELISLKDEIAALKAENAQTKTEREAARLDTMKIKLAKGKFPGWFDPTMLHGTNEDEIEAAIENMQTQMAAEAKSEDEKRKHQSFGGPTPKRTGQKQTGDDIMNDMLLARMGRTRSR